MQGVQGLQREEREGEEEARGDAAADEADGGEDGGDCRRCAWHCEGKEGSAAVAEAMNGELSGEGLKPWAIRGVDEVGK